MSEVKMKIIDLSHHNGKVDFVKVKASGIDGVIIRTGFGIESPKQVDRRFEDYYKGAKAAGMMVGAYHYCYAKTATEAVREADFMLKIMKGKSFELPVYGDFEEQGKISKSVCTAMVNAFCDRLEDAGAWAGIYSYDTFFRDKLSADIPKRYTCWVARVENIFPKCVSADNVGIWQYSWKGKVYGIKGNVDMDCCYRDFPAVIIRKGLNRF